MVYGRYNKSTDVGPKNQSCYKHASIEPVTHEELVGWLDDTSVLPEAEAYRFLNDALFKEFLSDAAERILLDMRGDFYTASEATEMYMLRQNLGHLGGYAVRECEGERQVLPTTVDLAA